MTDSWPSWLTQDRLGELETAAPDRPDYCPCCAAVYGICECPEAAVGLAVLLAARREETRRGGP